MAVKKTPKKKEEPAPPTQVEATPSTPKKAAKPKARKDAVAAAPAPEPAPEPKAARAKIKAPAAKAAEAKPEPKAAAKPEAKAAQPKAAAKADAKASQPKAAAKAAEPKAAEAKGPAKKAVAPIKLSDSQSELLRKIGESTEAGYSIGKKIEQRSIDALLERKLIKKGAKDKASGTPRYQISSAGKKHLSP